MSAGRTEGVYSRRLTASEAAGLAAPSYDVPADSRFHNPVVPRRASFVETTAKRSIVETTAKRSMMHEPVLGLNATYEPINVAAVRRAMVLLLKGVAQAEEMHNAEVHSAANAHKVPSVIRLLAYRHIPQQSRAVSRQKNFFLGGKNFPFFSRFLPPLFPRAAAGFAEKIFLVGEKNPLQFLGGVFPPQKKIFFARQRA